jgi:hypothetical protein
MASIKIELDDLTNSCFVIMPFTPTFDTEYEKVIRPAVEAAGIVPVRADEIYSRPQVMQDIWKALRASRIVIAELTGKNTNVFYEVGLAHTLGKPVIIITRNEEDVPFDLKALRYRYYNTEDPFWGENLKQAIKDMVVDLLKETQYGYVFEGIKLEGEIKYIQPKTVTKKPEIPKYDLTGVWQGNWTMGEKEYSCNLHLVQKGQEISGSLNVSFVNKKEKKEQLTIVQEMLVGEVQNDRVNVHAVSYSYVQQGFSAGYNLDAFVGEVSSKGDEISGGTIDEKGQVGSFSFKRMKTK